MCCVLRKQPTTPGHLPLSRDYCETSSRYHVRCESKESAKKVKALKCKPSAHYACAVSLIDGLGYACGGLPLVARGEFDMG